MASKARIGLGDNSEGPSLDTKERKSGNSKERKSSNRKFDYSLLKFFTEGHSSQGRNSSSIDPIRERDSQSDSSSTRKHGRSQSQRAALKRKLEVGLTSDSRELGFLNSAADIQFGSSYIPIKPQIANAPIKHEESKGTLTGLSSWARSYMLGAEADAEQEDYKRTQELKKLCGIGSLDLGNPTLDISYRRSSVGMPLVREPIPGRVSASTLDTNPAITQMYSDSKATNNSDKFGNQPNPNVSHGPIGRPKHMWSFTSGDTTSNNSSARAMICKSGQIGHMYTEAVPREALGQHQQEVLETAKKGKAESTPSRYQNVEGVHLPIGHNWSQKKQLKMDKEMENSLPYKAQNFSKVTKALFEKPVLAEVQTSQKASFGKPETRPVGRVQMHQSFVGHNKHSRRFTQGYDEFNLHMGDQEQDDYLQHSERKSKVDKHGQSRVRTEESQALLNSSMNNFSRKRTQPVFESEQYKIIKDKVLTDPRTTLMIRNIPNKYTKELMLHYVDEVFSDAYDFFYLPIDIKNGCNIGYAFINFKTKAAMPAFIDRFEGFKWQLGTVSRKVCKISYARIQGLEQLQLHFMESRVMDQQDTKIKPLLILDQKKLEKIAARTKVQQQSPAEASYSS